MIRMSRRQFLLASSALWAGATLASCAPYRSVDEGLEELAIGAEADAQAQPPIAEMRQNHARMLILENNRRCGIDEQGSSPQRCSVDELDAAAIAQRAAEVPSDLAVALTDSAHATKDGLSTIGSDSWLVLGSIYAELLTRLYEQQPDQAKTVMSFDSIPAEDVSLSKSEKAELLQLIAFHEAAIYGLGTAEAFASGQHADLFADMGTDHRVLVVALTQIAAANDLEPETAPTSYRMEGYEQMSDAATADVFVRQLCDNGRGMWDHFLTEASHSTAAQVGFQAVAMLAVHSQRLAAVGV
ncbi:hypothetical protein CCICO_07130 [Corynebacterium ciconiae DSM 44920]|uniref:hypothetical protein n=1 Tax=Corynebacterium ciconiae TaxID=227319 RepID=UPI0012EAA158|nr:hypothetical protein [Corynebacterium ciconiae]WKD61446.1 hypothetical protein CCICO_07130 [Corynebacterium ciconiae DSM 44920]